MHGITNSKTNLVIDLLQLGMILLQLAGVLDGVVEWHFVYLVQRLDKFELEWLLYTH